MYGEVRLILVLWERDREGRGMGRVVGRIRSVSCLSLQGSSTQVISTACRTTFFGSSGHRRTCTGGHELGHEAGEGKGGGEGH